MEARRIAGIVLFLVVALLLALLVLADEETGRDDVSPFLDPLFYIKASAVITGAVALLLLFLGNKLKEAQKTALFWLITAPVVISSLFLAGNTIYENAISETGGPIHWHADYQVWVCRQRLDLIDPKFPSNKIGTPLFHEHNDDRIHVEGTVQHIEDVNLGRYFATIGGLLEEGRLRYVAADAEIEVKDGDACPDSSVGTLQVYVNGKRTEGYADYQYYPHPLVPPGDCVIIEFDATASDTTDRICESWAASEWSYGSFKRPAVTIGEHTWQ